MITTKEFIKRRERLAEKMDDNSIAVLYAGYPPKNSADETYDFVVNRNFYYLSNIKQENSVLFILKQDGLVKEYLFISEFDEVKEKWTGKLLTIEEAERLSGVQNVLTTNQVESELDLILRKKNIGFERISTIYLDKEPECLLEGFKTTDDVQKALQANYPRLKAKDIYGEIVALRMVKSKDEVAELQAAIDKTNIGLKTLMKSLAPGKFEYQMSALFYYTLQDYDYSELSFPTICASGVNATTLHYPTPVAKIKENDLVLFDLGVRNELYCADISRTYPVSGKFSPLQKTIYQIVLDTNKLVLSKIKPGITLLELNDIAKESLAKGCLEAGLIKDASEISKYYFHSVGHHLGLDTHDPADRKAPLVAGNVITDEPGLYFKELGIGVRIEDDVLVTDEGSYCLSGGIIKEISEIEKAMGSVK